MQQRLNVLMIFVLHAPGESERSPLELVPNRTDGSAPATWRKMWGLARDQNSSAKARARLHG